MQRGEIQCAERQFALQSSRHQKRRKFLRDGTMQRKCKRTSSLRVSLKAILRPLMRYEREDFFFFVPIAERQNGWARHLRPRHNGRATRDARPQRRKERKMRRKGLLENGLMRLAACAVMAFAFEGNAWGQIGSRSSINPAFKQWQKERCQESATQQPITNVTSSLRRRLKSSAQEEGGLGFAPGTFDASYLSGLNVNSQQGVGAGFVSKYDLREHSALTPVKNQDPYGTCWAHAACASLESWLVKNGKRTFDFSENNMANLHGGDWGFDDGGNGDRASAYLLRWSGPVLESEDPYPNPGGSVQTAPARHVQNVRWIAGRTSYLDNDAIKQAILDFGATYVTYYHSSSYYKPSTASYYFYGNTSRSSNHAVAIVGWDDDYPASKFVKAPPGNGAFIVRNSWGSSWGDGGYFYVSYYDESFAWCTLYSFSNAEATDNYDAVYEFDPLGLVSSIGYRSTTAWGANMFQASSATKISAVGFYAMTPNTTYTIYVYTGCTADTPRSGTLAATQSGKSAYAGYVTVPLTSPASVSARQRFSVAVQLTTPGYNYPLAFEYAYPGYTSEATASSGQSFLSSNGSTWSDFTQVEGSANFCLKAYAKTAAAVKPNLSSVAISGVSSLTAGQSATFTCEATYSDGSKKTVTPAWSITEGRNYATISSAGLVTAKSVTAQQRVTVKASYIEDGVTKDATWGFYVTIAAPSAPTGVTATQGTETSCVRVNWSAPSGATEYAVYRAAANNSKNAQYLENVTVTRYNDTSAVPGVDYWYFVKAKNSSGTSGFSTSANGWRKLSPPENVIASDTLLDKVALEWSDVEGAKCYRVYRAASMDGVKSAVGGWQTATTFDDTTATAGGTYYSFVVAAVDASGSRPSDYSIVEDGMRAEPVRVASLAVNGAASIASGGNATYTARATYSDGTSKSVSPSWSLASGTAYAGVTAAGKVTAATVLANQTVTLKASYSEDGTSVTATKQIAITAVAPAAPTGLTLVSQTASGIALRWNPSAGAVSYKVYRAIGNGEASSVGSAAATSFTDSTAVPGVTYAYSVSAVNGAGESARSATVSGTVPLAAPTGVTATSDRTDGVLVSWQPVTGGSYYRVYRAFSSTGSATTPDQWVRLTSWLPGASYKDASATDETKYWYNDTAAAAEMKYWYFVIAAASSDGVNASQPSSFAEGLRKAEVSLSSISISGPEKVSASKMAMYSCLATYSDGTTRTVSPTWSVTPASAATIAAGGVLTAKAVSANVAATITASFTDGMTKIATKSVSIVVPAKATAEIRNINVVTRWPFSSLLDIDYELIVNPASAKAAVSVYGRDEDHGVAMAATTLSGDGADGSCIVAGAHRLTWDIGADYTNFHAKAFNVVMSAVVGEIPSPEFTIENGVLSAVNLNGVTDVEIPATVTSIGRNVFASKTITSLSIPGSVTNIQDYAFFGCRGLTSVTIPDSVCRIGYEAFYNCYTITNVTLGNGVADIGEKAFAYCSVLQNVDVPDGVQSIGKHAFFECFELGSVSIPSSVTNVGENAFADCWKLTTIDVASGNQRYSSANGILYNKDKTTLVACPGAFTSVTVPSHVTNIADYAFYCCRALTSVSIPSSVKRIGRCAFGSCYKLGGVTIPSSVTSIGTGAFNCCSRLESIDVASDNANYSSEGGVLYDKNKLLLIACPGGVTNATIASTSTAIGEDAFYGCRKLTSITIPNSVTNIGNAAFYLCENLEAILIGSGVRNIGNSVFIYCEKLMNVTILGALDSYTISSSLFGTTYYGDTPEDMTIYVTSAWTGPTDMWYGRSVQVIEYFDFTGSADWIDEGCGSWRSGSISHSQWSGISKLVSGIGSLSFDWMVSSETNYDKLTFFVDGVSKGYISGSTDWKTMEYHLDGGGLHTLEWRYSKDGSVSSGSDCGWISNIVWKAEPEFIVNNGVLTSAVLNGVTDVVIPDTVVGIGRGAFEGSVVKSVTMPMTVTNIGDFAFEDCGGLVSVTIPNSVTNIGIGAFIGCSNLGVITIPPSVSRIGELAFAYCSSLTNVTMLGELPYARQCYDGSTSRGLITYVTSAWSGPTGTWQGREVRVIDCTYCVIDLSRGMSSASYPVTFFDEPPGGGWSDEYKTEKLVLRKIPAGSFTMGCETNEVGYYGREAPPHKVTISQPFYMGVFEVTQRQFELVTGTRPSYFSNDTCYQTRPVEQVSWNDIRGNSSTYNWPLTAEVASSTFIGKLRVKTGIVSVDLPTEAKWEYACRAGTTTALNSGKNLINSRRDVNVDEVGRYAYNYPSGSSSSSCSSSSDLSEGTAAVGSYLPNSWGLYDMHGNVEELTLDWYQGRELFASSEVTDPTGPTSGSWRVRRDGGWNSVAWGCRSAWRNWDGVSGGFYGTGFRVSCSIVQ